MRANGSNFLLLIIAVILAGGIFLLVDSYSRLTVAVAQNTEALKQINDRLRLAPNSGGNYAAAANSERAAQSADLSANFANAEFYPADGKRGGVRVSAISAFSGNFNDLIRAESLTSAINSLCNDSLAARNLENPLEWQPVLAESWTRSDDGLVYVIKLRRNATWHPYRDPVTQKEIPAKPVTADDFVFFWECLQNPEIPCDSLRNYFAMMEAISALDAYTLRIEWREPYSMSEAFTLGLSPMPRHYYRPDPMTDSDFANYLKTTPRNQFVVGCGAYRFAEFKPNDSLTFALYDDYYGVKPFTEKIIWRVIPEPNIQLVEFEKGVLSDLALLPEQWVKETPPPRYRVITPTLQDAAVAARAWEAKKAAGETPDNYRWEKFQYEPTASMWQYIGYNLQNPRFADKRVRRALTMLIDRERILREVYLGFGELCDGPFVKNSPYADREMEPIAFSPDAAKKLLAEAGWGDSDRDGILDREIDGKKQKFSFTLIYNSSNPLRRQIATIIQADFKKAGIEMQINSLDWSVLLQKVEDKAFDACLLGWVGTLESDPYQIWHSSQAELSGSSNHIRFANAAADKLIEAGRREIDRDKRIKIYHEFYRLIAEEQPYAFLISNVSLIAQKKNIRNALIYKLGMSDTYQWEP